MYSFVLFGIPVHC